MSNTASVSQNENIIEFDDVTFSYDGINNIVENFSIGIKRGEFVSVLGLNGCGKSTVAKHINAILKPSKGRVSIEGNDTSDEKLLSEIRKRVGMVFQNPDNQFVASIVEEDVAFGPENYGLSEEEVLKRVESSLNRVGMSAYAKNSPQFLSGGQKQRVAIAGVMALQPDVVVFDESTAMLDPKGREDLLEAIHDLNVNHGITTILITHYMEEAARADRIAVMDGGRVVAEGLPEVIFADVQNMKDLGLDVPQITELSYELKKEGIPINKTVLSVDELAEALLSVITTGPE